MNKSWHLSAAGQGSIASPRMGAARRLASGAWQRAARLLAELAQAATNEWLPMRCVLCMRRDVASSVAGTALCADCDAALPGRHEPRCLRCAVPHATISPAASAWPRFCNACQAASPFTSTLDAMLHGADEADRIVDPASDAAVAAALDMALTVSDYAPPIDRLILTMKRSRPELAAPLGVLAADALQSAFATRAATGTPPSQAVDDWLDDLRPQAIVPMPLSTARLAERGFNQSRELARAAARRLRLPLLARGLRRTRDTTSQKSLSAAARADNLAGAFEADPAQVTGQRLLLVDDVMTTGATLREAAWALKDAGAASVVGLVVARVR